MAKKEAKVGEKAANQEASRPSNVRSYFTKEINDQMSEMSLQEMESVMKDLVNTRHWIAILKYTSMRTPLLDATLRSADPTKKAHEISWAQGAMAGLCDIESYVIELNNPTPKSQDDTEEFSDSRPEGTIIG